MVNITVKDEDVFKHKTPCLILLCPEEKLPSGFLKQVDGKLNDALASAYKAKRFEGKLNQTILLNANGMLSADNILLAGVGKAKDVSVEKIRQASATASRQAEKARFTNVSFFVPKGAFSKAQGKGKKALRDGHAGAIAEGTVLSLYHFDEYKSVNKDDAPSYMKGVTLLSPAKPQTAAMRKAVGQSQKLTDAVTFTRNLKAQPSNKATPSYIAAEARKMARKHKLACKVLGKKEMEKLGMGALLGVSRGSHEPPAFIILEHKGGKKNDAPVVIVGKGVTFDTGGISLKPGAHMDEMKFDMSGGAVALGTMQAAASLKLPVNVVGIVPLVENMPGGSAIKPGDILKSLSGKTIEVLNTDAEGRLILSDALAYAQRFKPKALIDLATLTGAVIMALGHVASAVIGTDAKLIDRLKKSGDVTGERLWELPLYEEYEKAVKSDIADLKNIATSGVGAGTATGAAFLKPFAGDGPWAHIDIAGTSWTSEAKHYVPKGGTGFGVRLLVDYLKNL